MESVMLESLNVGILVEKEIVVHTNSKDSGDFTASHPPSVVSVVHSTSDLRRETRTSELRKTASTASSGKMLPRTDVSENHLDDLADFFRSAPPPGNLMSIPDDVSISSADGKWGVFKVFRKKRKRRKRQPPLVRLPDSTVSARTAGGHRYIAISIPADVSLPYPESGLMDPGLHQAISAISNQTSSHGVKTSGPATEDHESLSSASLAQRSVARSEEATRLAPPPRKVSMLSTVPSQEESPSSKGKEPDSRGRPESGIRSKAPMSPLGSVRTARATERGGLVTRTEQQDMPSETGDQGSENTPQIIEIPSRKRSGKKPQQKQLSQASNEPTSDSSAAKNRPRSADRSPGTPHILSANPLNAPTPPVRTSSKKAKTSVSVLSEGENFGNRSVPMSRGASSKRSGNKSGNGQGPRGSFAESLMTESSPKLFKAQTATAYQSVPIVVRPPSQLEVESPLNLNFPTPPSNRTSRSVQADLLSPPEAAERSRTRKDRVKERKQRDMEKLKAQLRQIQSPASHLKPEIPTEHLLPESPVLGRFHEGLGSASTSRPYLTAKMSDIGPSRPSLHLKSSYLSPETVLKNRRGRSISAPAMTSSSSPSPLESPLAWEDTTAYFRRKERQAEREESEARRLRHAAKVLAEEKETRDRIAHQKLIRRYERLKESRTRDMERRLHRLERNSEMLMQSMVSLMETLNKLLQDRQSLQRSASAYPVTTSAPRSHGKRRQGSGQGRTQSLRSARSDDRPLQAPDSQSEREERHYRGDRPAGLRLSGGSRRGEFERERNLSQPALEALQEHLQAQSYQSGRVPGVSGYASMSNSSDNNSDAGSLEIMEPLMRELQGAARLDEEQRTPLTESEVFNLF
ncbi:uncharacterized protein F4822DRAFT_390425 [Hypoxylon trugodes]|uniref:uncharacterized protein n=1 Tax=Hypoxylon trugodes TaxID=326681 RepID=UPI00218FD4FD|nr:uncharacterized protein F4822DRAFT_390425 [Hypoxylon trugodes]KAI1392296.1 hypothetical protein F4822DRAFT_390425 [Hypoxylon trugodes]